MIKVKDGYAKLIGVSALGAANQVLLSNGGNQTVGNASGNIPLSNGTVNINLNADLLDGLDSTMYGQYVPKGEISLDGIRDGFRAGKLFGSSGAATSESAYRGFLEYGASGYIAQFNSDVNYLYYRWCENKTWGQWKTIAFTDSNVASATKLATPRKIWGQSFDGTGDVTGFLYPGNDGEYFDSYGNMTLSEKSGSWNVFRLSNENPLLRVTSSGNVGIGTKTPSAKLHVAGDARIEGNLVVTGCVYGAHYYETSDSKYKTNIQSIVGIDNIPQLRKFNWKEDGKIGYGFIAQELEEQGYYELVDTDEQGEKTVNYSAALSLIVGKLQVKIKELENEIETLKNKN